MEKTTKRKKNKSLKKRIGIFAVGGLSLVLTICLSVGATLAWFAGSTWSNESLFMGGPVYVEMAGRGEVGSATWQGGTGNLDIVASSRNSGTITGDGATTGPSDTSNILLPGQRFEVYSQARVYSTAYASDYGTSGQLSNNSGANVTNTSGTNSKQHITSDGRVITTTTSVLRARFSISIEFDPSVGFNNFTNAEYRDHYPVQSSSYTGHVGLGAQGDESDSFEITGDPLSWDSALGATAFDGTIEEGELVYPEGSRRDAVQKQFTDADSEVYKTYTNALDNTDGDLDKVKTGEMTSIYAWKFVSSSTYKDTNITSATAPTDTTTGTTTTCQYAKMPAPFDGSSGYYGVWILGDSAKTPGNKVLTESNAFYKDRCNAYIGSYVEEYLNEYNNITTREIGNGIAALEVSLNQSFVNLVNDSSDAIIAGKLFGMTVGGTGINYANSAGWAGAATNASWLYIDPSIGNDTNTDEISTGAGGWWYLVECNEESVKAGANKVGITKDSATFTDGSWTGTTNTPTEPNYGEGSADGTDYILRSTTNTDDTMAKRLDAKLYEISPMNNTDDLNNGSHKVVSYSFPFVNGISALPGDALTNVFANAKITFQISFQALQAFFPYSTEIDSMDYTNPLLGTAKALSIKNAIPIYNEAFDYQETLSSTEITGL